MAAELTIRRLQPDEASAYNAFFAQGTDAHPDTLRITRADIEAAPFVIAPVNENENEHESVVLVAVSVPAARWLGVVAVERERGRTKRRHIAWLVRMYVEQSASGRGVGRALVRAAIAEAAAMPGVTKLNLTVVEHNLSAVGLYTSEGFVTFAREEGAFRDEPTHVELAMSRKVPLLDRGRGPAKRPARARCVSAVGQRVCGSGPACVTRSRACVARRVLPVPSSRRCLRRAHSFALLRSDMIDQPSSDALSVADFDRRLRRAVEGLGASTWVAGEVASCKPAASGHIYFTLKDEREDAALECVMYRTQALRARGVLVDGARVSVRGQATVWAPRGRLQFVADAARPAGRGALLEALEQLKQKLAAEGLFAPARKRPLPRRPKVIGVVTSARGAAVHDIAKVAFSRGAARILVAPSVVQGDAAPASLVRALDLLERVRDLDVIIIGRGGGAAEDLAAFQDERVVRRVAACRVPVVSAVGHEIDVTLTDLAADVRAATPSHAAELLVPDAAAQTDQLRALQRRLVFAMQAHLTDDRRVLERLQTRLGRPTDLVNRAYERLDDLENRLGDAMERTVRSRRDRLLRLSGRLAGRHPRAVIAVARGDQARLRQRLVAAMNKRIVHHRNQLGMAAHRLDALSPLSVLGRGYAIVTDAGGKPLLGATEAPTGSRINVRLHRGSLVAEVVASHAAAPTSPTSPEPSVEHPHTPSGSGES
jgi:exodeoxyribonuclease VII large subunit